MPKLITVVGARPQFIKAAAVSEEVRERRSAGSDLEEVLLHTGQHYDFEMSAVFFGELALKEPDHYLGVGSRSAGDQTGQMLIGIERVLIEENPDAVLVYGDTNSTLAGGLAAAQLNIPLIHVEAGLRSFKRSMPEEINRIVTDHLSRTLLCSSSTGVRNLEREGITSDVHMVGDVMQDLCLRRGATAEGETERLTSLGIAPGSYALATIHRAEATQTPHALQNLFRGLDNLARTGLTVIAPLHPRTRAALANFGIESGSVKLLDPLSYDHNLVLQMNARVILTDSGGIQKEAYWLGVPCVTLREETEWVETIETGWNELAGYDPELIVESALRDRSHLPRPPLYGDGKTAAKIVDIIAPRIHQWASGA